MAVGAPLLIFIPIILIIAKITICDNNQAIFNSIIRKVKEVSDIEVLDVSHMSRKMIRQGTEEIPIEYFYTEISAKDVDIAILSLPAKDRNWLYFLFGADLSGSFRVSGCNLNLSDDEKNRLINICNKILYFFENVEYRDAGNLNLEVTQNQYDALIKWVVSFNKKILSNSRKDIQISTF